PADPVEQFGELGPIGKFNILLGEIQFQFDHGGKMEQFLPKSVDLVTEPAPHLLYGNVVGGLAVAGDKIGHGLCLAQVHLAMEKGPKGELPGLGRTAALSEQQLYALLLDIGRTMTGNLDHVLPGIGVGPLEEGDQYLVHDLSILQDMSQMDGMALLV